MKVRPILYVHPMLKNHVNGCHGNHAFFHNAIQFIFDDKNSLLFWGPKKLFGTNEKLSCVCIKLASGVPRLWADFEIKRMSNVCKN